MEAFLFYFCGAVTILGGVAMVASRSAVGAACWLVLSFLGMAGVFASLHAPFLAVMQVLVYTGAVMVLFIFVIMMINLKEGVQPERKRWTMVLSFLIGIVLIIELILAVTSTLSPAQAPGAAELANPSNLGKLLFTEYLYPFEITSILIIAVLVGTIVLVKKKDTE